MASERSWQAGSPASKLCGLRTTSAYVFPNSHASSSLLATAWSEGHLHISFLPLVPERQHSSSPRVGAGMSTGSPAWGCAADSTSLLIPLLRHRAVAAHIQAAPSSKEWPIPVSLGNLLPRDASSVPGQLLKQQVKLVC